MLPTTPPCELTAGDSAAWSVELADHPAPEWAVTYTLIGAESIHTVHAQASGTGHSVTLGSTDTASWAPGRYKVVGYAAKGTDRRTFHRSDLVVQADPATATPADTRSHARKVLDAIEAFLETGDQLAAQVQIADRRIGLIPTPDLIQLRELYLAEVAREEGKGRGGRVYTRLG